MINTRLFSIGAIACLIFSCAQEKPDSVQNTVSAAEESLAEQQDTHENLKKDVNKHAHTHSHKHDAKSVNKLNMTSIGKPSAPINYQSDYDGNSIANQLEKFTASFSSPQAGTLSVSISSRNNILLNGVIKSSHKLTANESIDVPINVYAHTDGKFYIDVITTLESNGNQVSKAFTQAIYVGNWKETAEKLEKSKTREGGKKVVSMPAVETISK